ncbi:uncharacterized protein LOC144099523 [Amblyomma americanum]
MWIFVLCVLASLCCTTEVLGKLGAPGGPQKLHHDVADTVKAFSSFEYTVAISNSDNDTSLECLYATRTDVDLDAKTATYAWFFPRNGTPVHFHDRSGDQPGTMIFTVEDDPAEHEGVIYYTDYVNCVIADMEYHGHQCTLWAQRAVKDNVPQECIDQFVDTCGVTVPQHSRDLCVDGEGDY